VGSAHQLRLLDVRPIPELGEHEALQGQLEDLEVARAACREIDVVLHLAANASQHASFDALLHNNYIATHNIFTAAHEAGCRRVIFASSVHTIRGLPPERRFITEQELCPGNLYGVSKAYGENLANYFAHVHSLSGICFRFGLVAPTFAFLRATDDWERSAFLSARDLCRLLDLALTTEAHFAVLNATSNNADNLLDLSRTRAVLGYAPQDSLEAALEEGNREQGTGMSWEL
jgi:nucleoside-diphosphate-sugar epimerase